jgi:threonine synthase
VSIRYACVSCGRELETDEVVYRCPHCTGPHAARPAGFLKGALLTLFAPKGRMKRGSPVDPLSFLPYPVPSREFPVGNTAMAAPRSLREESGLPNLFFKLDSLNPSGSLKDRASLLVAAQALHHGVRRVALASTGNAGASMACAGAALGIEVVLFVPSSAPPAKLLQSLLYGARVVPIRGTYDDAFALSIRSTERFGGINRNTAYNPLTIEGKKTVSLEIYNQLGCVEPDAVYVPTGDGVIISGVWKGFSDLNEAGFTRKVPVMVAAQALGSNAIAMSFKEGREVTLTRAETIADSLCVASPANGEMALQCLGKTGGRAVEVDDAEISRAQAALCRAGLFVEPSSAAAWAGLLKDRKNLDREARVVVLLTGTGFKDIGAVEKLARIPEACPPDLEAAEKLLEREYGIRSQGPRR